MIRIQPNHIERRRQSWRTVSEFSAEFIDPATHVSQPGGKEATQFV
jgi:hypothetical protein